MKPSVGMWEQLPDGANRHRLVWEIQSLCPLPIQDKLLLDEGSFKVIILGSVLGLGFNSLEEGKTTRFLIYFIPTAFLHSMPSLARCLWHELGTVFSWKSGFYPGSQL